LRSGPWLLFLGLRVYNTVMSKKYYIYVETTVWQEPGQSNHVYVFTEPPKGRAAKCMGYVRAGTKELFKFKNPYTIDLKNRTFEALT